MNRPLKKSMKPVIFSVFLSLILNLADIQPSHAGATYSCAPNNDGSQSILCMECGQNTFGCASSFSNAKMDACPGGSVSISKNDQQGPPYLYYFKCWSTPNASPKFGKIAQKAVGPAAVAPPTTPAGTAQVNPTSQPAAARGTGTAKPNSTLDSVKNYFGSNTPPQAADTPPNTFDPSVANTNKMAGLNADGTLKNSAPFGGGSVANSQANPSAAAAAQTGANPSAVQPGTPLSDPATAQNNAPPLQTDKYGTSIYISNQPVDANLPAQQGLATTPGANPQAAQPAPPPANAAAAAPSSTTANANPNGRSPANNGANGDNGNNGNGNNTTNNNNGVSQAIDGMRADSIRSNSFTPQNDTCGLSNSAGGTSCTGMRSTMAVTQTAAQVASTIGSQAVMMIGQQSQQAAMMSGGSMASIYQGSAALSAKAAEANIGMGTVQMGMGILINHQASAHAKEYSDKFKTLKYGYDPVTGNNVAAPSTIAVTENGGNDANVANQVYNKAIAGTSKFSTSTMGANGNDRHATITNPGNTDGVETMDAKAAAATASAQSYAHAAAVEQNTAAVDGHAAALTNLAQGGGAVVSGAFQYAQAKQMQSLYAQMANAPTVTAPGANPFAAPGAIRSANTISGSGTNPNTAAATAATAPAPASSGGPLGPPLGTLPSGPAFGTPAQQPMAAQTPPMAGPMGGPMGGDMGGVGTAVVPGSTTDNKPAAYDTARNAAGYQGVGGFAPGGSGGGKGNANDPTIDPKTLMAAMLDQMGQKKEEDQAPGILNYRALASDANAPLPAEENFFTRFHADYQDLQRKGQVGL